MFAFYPKFMPQDKANYLSDQVRTTLGLSRDVVYYNDRSVKYADLDTNSFLPYLQATCLDLNLHKILAEIAPFTSFRLMSLELHRYVSDEMTLSLHQDNYGWHITAGLAYSFLLYLGPILCASPISFYPGSSGTKFVHVESEIPAYSSALTEADSLDLVSQQIPLYTIGDLSVHCHLTPHGPGHPVHRGASHEFLRLVYFSSDVTQDNKLVQRSLLRVARNRQR